eukprot:15448607-Alexandrium_andersonii.AAC.1
MEWPLQVWSRGNLVFLAETDFLDIYPWCKKEIQAYAFGHNSTLLVENLFNEARRVSKKNPAQPHGGQGHVAQLGLGQPNARGVRSAGRSHHASGKDGFRIERAAVHLQGRGRLQQFAARGAERPCRQGQGLAESQQQEPQVGRDHLLGLQQGCGGLGHLEADLVVPALHSRHLGIQCRGQGGALGLVVLPDRVPWLPLHA